MKKMKHLLVAALACISMNATAQEKGAPAGMTKEQQAKFVQWQKEIDKKINAGFAGNEKLKSEMQEALKNISAMKDEKSQYAAAASYQNKYSEAYSMILKKSGVDLASAARELQSFIPNIKFTVKNNTIVGVLRQSPGSTPNNPPEGPKTKRITDFNTHKEKSCGAGAGGDVTFTESSIKVYAVAAVVGGCDNDGDMSAVITVPKANSAKLKLKYKAKVDGFAAAIGGTSVTSCYASCISGGDVVFSVSGYYIATILWVGFGEEEIDETQTLILTPERNTSVKFYNSVLAISGVAETHGGSKTTGIDVKLITE